jgi:hypothetical protein
MLLFLWTCFLFIRIEFLFLVALTEFILTLVAAKTLQKYDIVIKQYEGVQIESFWIDGIFGTRGKNKKGTRSFTWENCTQGIS